MQEVEDLAQKYRLEQARQATEAEGSMGHPEAKVSAIEHELRMYAHDVLKPHHDKDYRSLAVYPLEQYGNIRLMILRVDYKGDVLPEIVQGPQWRAGQPTVWALIFRGHMMMLVPPQTSVATKQFTGPSTYTTPSLGFHYYWHQRHDQPRTAPGVISCRHCKPPKRAGAEEVGFFVRKTSCLAAVATCAGSRGAPTYRVIRASTPAGPSGLVVQEYFAGHGVISQGWRAQGERALTEIELYEDPHRKKGPRPDQDLTDPGVQQRCLDHLNAGAHNVEWIACPCTTFCDWNLQNGGARTFAKPTGQPTDKEGVGNTLSNFGAKLFETALAKGHFPIAESSGTSGRYPKQWHLPAWKKLLQRPDVDFLEIDMCAFGLAPHDAAHPGQFYRHRTGLAFPRHVAFARPCFVSAPACLASMNMCL